ncbi:xylulokinase [Alicyclobacillus acidiphilus]|uniref:xylulokinase n=1 Tax=Alicyclobacillus acidiphilus TaxID=182455 RepID=UPI00082F9B6D|nr:xylulokinase [Alicyclobacillus acidiphilus]
MKYVIGVDLGTSSVKVLLVDEHGHVCGEAAEQYQLIQERSGWSEQNPEDWFTSTKLALKKLVSQAGIPKDSVEGISFSGQMHGLVLLDAEHRVIRNAILWNDTRTTEQCRVIEQVLGDTLLEVARNKALEGFTLPKLLWVKDNEPRNYEQIATFLLPKDYLRFRLTNCLATEYSDAAGTIMMDVRKKQWSPEILQAFGIPQDICPPLMDSGAVAGTLLPEVADEVGLTDSVKVFAGGADNACGAIGAGILSPDATLCSIGTSGVVLNYEEDSEQDYHGQLHFFNHGKRDAYYSMGVTLAAGFSLSWFKDTFARASSFNQLLEQVGNVPIGAGGLVFTPYLVGERTPHSDSVIRSSFIGIDAGHTLHHFARAVVEGITMSLRESIQIMSDAGRRINTIVSIGGGSRSDTWLQIQADVFGAEVVRLESEQGPALGAAMLAAVGCGWFSNLDECAKVFISRAKTYSPIAKNTELYDQLYAIYREVYPTTRSLNQKLQQFRI